MLIALALSDPNSSVLPYALSEKALLIGRHPDCFIKLDHNSISRHHTKIHEVNGVWQARDMNSRNGTYRNGQRISSEELLQEGDILHVGDWALAFSERAPENLISMSSWLRRIQIKAAELSLEIYFSNNKLPEALPSIPIPSPVSNSHGSKKVVRAKPSDMLKNPAYQGTAALPTISKELTEPNGLKLMKTPALPPNHKTL
jgi:predicted component of type VI protein secretion system